MDPQVRMQAEHILALLCVGRVVWGVKFVGEPVLILGIPGRDVAEHPPKGPNEAFLHVEAGCAMEGGPTLDVQDLAQVVVTLRDVPVVSARLGERQPDLLLEFENGQVLRINGHGERYEPWSIAAGDWSIYALDQGKLTWSVPHPALS